MINLFKKKVKEVYRAATTTQTNAEVVEEIHKQFYTASDRLVENAEKVLSSLDVTGIEKAGRLAKLGFSNVPQVVDSETQTQLKLEQTQLLELLMYYRRTYPLFKVITKEEVSIICKKYSLVVGEVSLYKGFVPEKNLRDIEAFKGASNNDQLVEYRYLQHRTSSDTLEVVNRRLKSYVESERNKDYLSREIFQPYIINSLPLLIAAPVKDMNVSNHDVREGFLTAKAPIDPIVMTEVRGGLYMIITAWGDEASDPIVVNNINN